MSPVPPDPKRRRLKRLATVGTFLAVGMAVFYSFREAREWKDRLELPPSEFDGFVNELREAIPEDARVVVVCADGEAGQSKHAYLLSARLHPRVVLFRGTADWIVEIPVGEFSRAQSSWKSAGT